MVSPTARRPVATWLQKKRHFSERRACALLGLPRSTYRYQGSVVDKDRALRREILQWSTKHPTYGYRMVYKILRRAGWRVNRKRIYRIWRREGLQVHRRVCPRKHAGHSRNSISRKRPKHVGHVWGLDFVHDETTDGRVLRWLTVIDEYSRFNLSVEVRRNFPSTAVIGVLDELVAKYGYPKAIRCDNGPELIANVLKKWAEKKTTMLYIARGSPWENGYTERFNGTFRSELLDQERFDHILEAQLVAQDWRGGYNGHRPHTSLNDRTPAEVFHEGLKRRK